MYRKAFCSYEMYNKDLFIHANLQMFIFAFYNIKL